MIIILIVILGLIFRLVNLNQSLWLDEAVQAITAQKSLNFAFQELSGDFHPPLYHLLIHYWVGLFGSTEIALRMPSVLFGVGTIWVIWKICRLSNLKRLSYLGALFLAMAPFHIYYSQEARMYSMAAFLTAGSFYFFLKIIEDDKGWLENGRGIGYFVFTLLALYTDYYAFLILLAQGIYLVIRRKFKLFTIYYLLFTIFYFPWLPMLILQIKTGLLATQTLPGWGQLVNVSFLKAVPLMLVKFTLGRITIFNRVVYAFVSLGILVITGGLIGLGYKKFMKEKTDWEKVVLLWFFVPLLFSWFVSLLVPNFQPFRILLILPAFYLLLAEGIQEIKLSIVRNTLVFLLLLINTFSLGTYYFNQFFWREDWRGLIAYVRGKEGSLVILPSDSSNWPIKYYDSSGKIRMSYGATGVRKVGDLREMGDLGNKTFYIRYLVPLFDPEEKILAELEVRGYTKVAENDFNQIPLWEFQKR